MNASEIIEIRDSALTAILDHAHGVDTEHALVAEAAHQLEQIGSRGGSTRAQAETEIVRLI